MTISIALQFVVVLAAIWMGARSSGVGLGLWGAVGLLVLVVGERKLMTQQRWDEVFSFDNLISPKFEQ